MSSNTNWQKWNKHFLNLAQQHAILSKDPNTKVGAILVGEEDRSIISAGFNGFPMGIEDDNRLNDRELKLQLVVHAEMNAILLAAKRGISTKDAILYLVATDNSGQIWGGPPCIRCLVECIQAGIKSIVTYKPKSVPSNWEASLNLSREIISEAKLSYWEMSL